MKVKKLCETPGTALRANRWTGTKIRNYFAPLRFISGENGEIGFLRIPQFFAFQAVSQENRCIKMSCLWYILCLLSCVVLLLYDETFVCQ